MQYFGAELGLVTAEAKFGMAGGCWSLCPP